MPRSAKWWSRTWTTERNWSDHTESKSNSILAEASTSQVDLWIILVRKAKPRPLISNPQVQSTFTILVSLRLFKIWSRLVRRLTPNRFLNTQLSPMGRTFPLAPLRGTLPPHSQMGSSPTAVGRAMAQGRIPDSTKPVAATKRDLYSTHIQI